MVFKMFIHHIMASFTLSKFSNVSRFHAKHPGIEAIVASSESSIFSAH